jgi:hypothetical protein
MDIPPRKRVSQEILNEIYNSNEWQDRLMKCLRVEFENYATPVTRGQPWGTSTVGVKYYENGVRVAVVIFYHLPNGSIGASGKPSPKGLLIDGVWHYT